MRRRWLAMGSALALLASVLVVGAPPSSLAGSPTMCRAFADMPLFVGHDMKRPQLRSWGEFHCSSASTLAVQVCAARLASGGYTAELKPIWCVFRRARVAAGGKTFVRTGVHACAQGVSYIGYVRIIGYAWDQGPWRVCRPG